MTWLTQRVLLHFYFWGGFFSLLYYAIPENEFPNRLVGYVLTILGFCAIAVYINLYFLMPRMLERHYYILYFISLILSIIGNAYVFTTFSQKIFNDKTTIPQNVINLTAFVIISSALKMYRLGIKRQLAEKELLAKQLQAELKLLRAQINPHFLFNTLNNLYSLTLEKSDQAPEVVVKLSELMRYMLHTTNQEKSLLTDELTFIHNYLALEKLRLNNRANIQFEVAGEVRDKIIASLLFIPFIENAFKHGISATTGSAYLHGQLRVEENELYFYLENSITYLPSDESSGTGLENIKKRLLLLYPSKHELTFERKENKFCVNLHISLT